MRARSGPKKPATPRGLSARWDRLLETCYEFARLRLVRKNPAHVRPAGLRRDLVSGTDLPGVAPHPAHLHADIPEPLHCHRAAAHAALLPSHHALFMFLGAAHHAVLWKQGELDKAAEDLKATIRATIPEAKMSDD
jgi:hypothetical protein